MYQNDPGEGYACIAVYVPHTFTVTVRRADLKPLDPEGLRVRRRMMEDPNPG